MKFCILFALACICPVAFSHKQYVAIPISALQNGRADSDRNAVVYDISPLQVRSVGATRTGDSRRTTSTSTRRSSITGGRSGVTSPRTSALVRSRDLGSLTIRRVARGRRIHVITPTTSVTDRGSIRGIARGRQRRRRINVITPTTSVTNRGFIQGIARGSQMGSINVIAPTPSVRFRGTLRRVAGGPATMRNVNLVSRVPAVTGTVGAIIPSLTSLPSRAGTFVNGNVGFLTSVSPRFTSSFVNSVHQPHMLAGTIVRPIVPSNGFFVTWPKSQSPSVLVNAAIQQPLTDHRYFGLSLGTDPMSTLNHPNDPLSDFAADADLLQDGFLL